jgi:hypothetical protein
MFESVTQKNSLLYAMKHYDNPQCLDTAEFDEDYKHFKYVKRLCRRYLTNAKLREQLLLNHLVLLFNVFGEDAAVRLLFLKCDDPKMFRVLKTFLVYMERAPQVVLGINGDDIYMDAIPTDEPLLDRLRAL